MKSKRKSLSKKVRFEVFKRDKFACQYCGRNPPGVVLEVDHITPVSLGGGNIEDNLITSCLDCNRGKSNVSLESVPKTIKDKHEILEEKELQLKEYQKLVRKAQKRLDKEMSRVDDVYAMHNVEYRLSDKFLNSSVRMFLKKLPVEDVEEAMHIACSRVNDSNGCIKYFCGVCWGKIKEGSYE